MGLNPYTGSGSNMVDEVLGEAFQVVKHVNDKMEVIEQVAGMTDDIVEVSQSLTQAEGSILAGHVAIIIAGVQNFRQTFAEAVADFDVGEYFSSIEAGSLRIYKRTNVAPYYSDMGDIVAPISITSLALIGAALLVGAEDGDTPDELSNVQAQLDKRHTSNKMASEDGAGLVGIDSLAGEKVDEALNNMIPGDSDLNELTDIDDEINTVGKYKGKFAFNSVDNKLYMARGPSAGAIWQAVDGSGVINPV